MERKKATLELLDMYEIGDTVVIDEFLSIQVVYEGWIYIHRHVGYSTPNLIDTAQMEIESFTTTFVPDNRYSQHGSPNNPMHVVYSEV